VKRIVQELLYTFFIFSSLISISAIIDDQLKEPKFSFVSIQHRAGAGDFVLISFFSQNENAKSEAHNCGNDFHQVAITIFFVSRVLLFVLIQK
jgi:hypothetical protein